MSGQEPDPAHVSGMTTGQTSQHLRGERAGKSRQEAAQDRRDAGPDLGAPQRGAAIQRRLGWETRSCRRAESMSLIRT